MAITLIGEVANTCDTTTGFNQGNISGDDDFVQGTGAIGLKNSNGTQTLFTTSLGAGAPYNFSVGGAEEGYHIIMWFNTKSPINATSGLQIYVGDSVGGDNGDWNVIPFGFYKGGFVTAVVDTSRDFDRVTGFTVGGNPAQLTNINEIGGTVTTITMISGNFNNMQIDQITIGLGVRADAGTVGTPNTFETVRAADEDTNFWGWWGSSNGGVVGKGKLFIGPTTGSATSVFDDNAFTVVFAEERVATGFYEIDVRGAGTDVAWELGNVSAANPTQARWSLTIDSTTNSFSDINSVLSGFDIITLNANSTLTGTALINGNSLIQNGATITGCNFLNGNNANGVALVVADDAAEISNCNFESGGVGHAVEIAPAGAGPFSINWSGNIDSGYAGIDGSTGNETILINPVTSSADITLNILGGSTTPTIMLDAGYTGTFTLVVNPVTTTITVTDITNNSAIQGARVLLLVNNGSNFPFNDVVTATSSGTTATITHTGHGLESNDYIQIKGANEEEYNGVFQITVTGVNSYTYTMPSASTSPATGTLNATLALISGLTDINGQISDTRSISVNQPVTGRVRASSPPPPFFKTSAITGTINNLTGLDVNIQMLRD